MVTYFMLFVFVCFITYIIYNDCIVKLDLEHTISLGAVFATLGSSLVTVLSLTCSEQYSQFVDNIKILETSLFNKDQWMRWPFVKRIQKIKITKGEYYYYILDNPIITFKDDQWKIEVLLPSGKYDFRELPVYQTIFKLILNKKKYYSILLTQGKMNDKLIWECITKIYINIFLYRCSQIIIWIGACFIFSSIFFSFFYINIVKIIG